MCDGESIVSKTQLGYLLVVILSCSAYIVAQEEVKFKVSSYKSTICVWGGDYHYDIICGKGWIRGGDEYSKLFRGTTRVYANSREVLETFDGNKTNFTRVAITNDGPTLIDNYLFDGNVYDKEKVPIEHTITVINGSGLFYQYEANNLKYEGESRSATSPESFGNNIDIEWEGTPHIHKIYKYKYRDICKLTLKWRVESDYEVYTIRMFDPVSWWNSAWERRKEINITENSNTNLIDVVIELNITKDVEMNSDYSDLRFLSNCSTDAVELSYWDETQTASHAMFWVKLPTLNALETKTICMYYNNTGASSTANGENTFDFFDDFPDATIDWSKWDSTLSAGMDTKEIDGNGDLHLVEGGLSWACFRSNRTVNSVYNWTNNSIYKVRLHSDGDSNFLLFGSYTYSAFIPSDSTGSPTDRTSTHDGVAAEHKASSVNPTSWDTYTIKRANDAGYVAFYKGNGATLVNNHTTRITAGNLSIDFCLASGDTPRDFWVNWIFFTDNYASPEPTYIFGSEEDSYSSTSIYFNGSQAYTYFETPTMINITANANVSGNTMCLSIDHPDYGTDYICGGQSVESNISIMAAINIFNDSTTEKSLTANGSIGFDVDHTYIFSRADIDITGYNNTNYPVDIKVDIGNDGYDDIYFAGTLTGLNLENDKLNDGNTYYDLNFTEAGEQTLYIDYFGQFNASHVSFNYGTFLAPNQSFEFTDESLRIVDTGIRWLCYGPTGGYIGSTMYSIGGKCSSVDGVAGWDYNTTFNFDLDTELWTTGTDVQTDVGQSACSVSNGTYIWIIGGGGSGTDVNTVYRFDGTTYTALASASINRSMATCVLDNGKIYVFGGYDEGSNELSSTEIFNLSDNIWYSAASMPAAKAGLMSSLFNSTHLIAWGGWLSGSTLSSKTYVYEMSSNTWTDISATAFRRGGGAGVNIKDEIFSISGWYTTYHKTIHKFNKDTLVWVEQPDQLPQTMYLPPQSTIEINGTVFLFFTTIQGYGDELMKVHFTPKEPLISIGDQQSFWTFDKYWDGESVASGDLSEDWNKYIAGNCNTGRCSVPINIYSGSAGGINISNINVTSIVGAINLNQTAFDLNESTYGTKEIELATTANTWGNVTFNNLNSTFYGDVNFTIIANYTGDSVTNSSTTRVLGLRYSNYTADFPYESDQLIFWLNSVNETNVTPVGQSSWMNGTTFNFTRLWDWDVDIGMGLNQSLDSCLDLMVDNDTTEFIMSTTMQTVITTKPNSTRAWGINYRLNASSCNRTALGVYTFYPWFDVCCSQCYPCWA